MIDYDPSSIFDLTTSELLSIRQRLDIHVAPAPYVRVLEQELRERQVTSRVLSSSLCAQKISRRRLQVAESVLDALEGGASKSSGTDHDCDEGKDLPNAHSPEQWAATRPQKKASNVRPATAGSHRTERGCLFQPTLSDRHQPFAQTKKLYHRCEWSPRSCRATTPSIAAAECSAATSPSCQSACPRCIGRARTVHATEVVSRRPCLRTLVDAAQSSLSAPVR